MSGAKLWWQGLLLLATLLPLPLATLTTPLFDYEDFKCLVRNAYYEARGEKIEGMIAVTRVVINRASMLDLKYCETVYKRNQFSWTRGKIKPMQSGHSEAEKSVWAALNSSDAVLANATHYHSKQVSPKWAKSFRKVATIGNHIFYEKHK